MFCTPFWVCSVGLFVTFVPRTMACMCSVDGLLHLGVVHCFSCVLLTFCHASVSRTVWYESSWQFLWLVSFALFRMFLLTLCHVSALRTVFYVMRLIVWYVSASRIGLNVFCKTFCWVRVLRTLFSVFCWIVCDVTASDIFLYVFCLILCHVSALHNVLYVFFFGHGSVLGTVFNVFWWLFVTLVLCTLFCMCSVWLFGRLVARALFWMCSV